MRVVLRGLSLPLLWIGNVVSLLILLIPPVLFAAWAFVALWNRADFYLAQAAPIASAEASQYLKRPVQIGGITPGLTLDALLKMIRRPQDYGSLAVTVTDVSVRNRPEEENLAGGPLLAFAPRIVALISLPALLSGNFPEAVARISVESPEVVVVRDPQGKINLENVAPKRPPSEPGPPFRTVVEIVRAKLRVRDYQSRLPNAPLPAENALFISQALVDLTGARALTFSASATALPGSATVARLGGPLTVSGTARREEGHREERPANNAPQLLLNVDVKDADAAYWVASLLPPQEGFRIEAGRVDAVASLVQPYTDVKPAIEPQVGVDVIVRGGRIAAKTLPVAAENLNGTLSFREKALRFDVNAQVADAPISASGVVWNLTGQPTGTRPQLTMSVTAPRLPLARLLPTLLPKGAKLPPGLSVSGVASVNGVVAGTLTGKLADIQATGTVTGVNAAYTGYPAARNVQAKVAFAGGLLRLSEVQAALGQQGQVRGAATFRVEEGTKQIGDALFSGTASNIDLTELTALKSLSKNPNERLRLKGIASVQAIGQRVGGKINAAANVTARDLQVGNLPFPVAQMRVLVQDNQVFVPQARIESPAGIARIDGDVGAQGRLNLRFALGALDLKRLSLALGIATVDGLVSASGTVTGTALAPIAHVSRFEALNLRYVAPTPDGKATRPLAVDVISAENITLTRDRLTIPASRPLSLRRFPASAAISGEIAGLTPPVRGGKWNPRLALLGRLENLDYAEVERQLGISIAPTGPQSVTVDRLTQTPVSEAMILSPWQGGRVTMIPAASVKLPLARDLPPLSGTVLRSQVKATGTLSNPQIVGNVALGNLLVGSYPLQSGSFAFAFTKGSTTLTDVAVKASVGTLTGRATLRPDGTLSGTFTTPAIDTARLVYLTKDLVSLRGLISVSGAFQGTVKRPVVTASVSSPEITVAGTTYNDLLVNRIRFIANLDAKRYSLEVPSASLSRQDARISATNVFADLGSGELRAKLDIKNGDLQVVLDTLRQSGISQTVSGAQLLRTLGKLPYPIAAIFDINDLTFNAKQANGKLTDIRAQGTLSARKLRAGQFTADDLTIQASLIGDKITVPSFVITRPGATIRGQGTYDAGPGGLVNASLDSNDFSLDIIRSIPGLESFPVRGSLESFSLTADGPSARPRLALSLQGRNLLILTNRAAENVAAVSATGPAAGEKGVIINLARLEAFVEPDAQGNQRIIIPEDGIFVQRGAAELRASAELPFSYSEGANLADRPISVKVRLPQVDLASLRSLLEPQAVIAPNPAALTRPDRFAAQGKKAQAAVKEAATTDIGGNFAANVSLTGTLNQPKLDGLITLEQGRFRLPREPGSSRDRFSPIKNFDARLTLDGNRIVFDTFKLALDGLNGQRGDFGDVTVTGFVALNTLQSLQRALRGEAGSGPGINGQYDLNIGMRDFRPAGENLSGLGEAFRAKIKGDLKIAGRLLEPEISTPANQPLRVDDAEYRLPVRDEAAKKTSPPKAFNPTFNVAISIPKKARIAGQNAFLPLQFDVRGDATLTGPLFVREGASAGELGFSAIGNLTTTGGFVQFPTALFKVDKNGVVNLRYGTVNPGIRASNVTAVSRIVVRDSAPVSSGSSSADALFGSGSTSYKVTLALDGPLDILTDGGNLGGNVAQKTGGNYTLTSDPPLPESEIIGLIAGKSLVSLTQGGRTEDALRAIAAQALTSSYLPRYLSPITDSLANTLGLEDIAVDYSPNAPLRLRFLKRLSKPFDRVVVDVSRLLRVQTEDQQTVPFRFSVSYEIFQFRASDRVQPRIQIGIDSNEQGTVTYFTRGTISY